MNQPRNQHQGQISSQIGRSHRSQSEGGAVMQQGESSTVADGGRECNSTHSGYSSDTNLSTFQQQQHQQQLSPQQQQQMMSHQLTPPSPRVIGSPGSLAPGGVTQQQLQQQQMQQQQPPLMNLPPMLQRTVDANGGFRVGLGQQGPPYGQQILEVDYHQQQQYAQPHVAYGHPLKGGMVLPPHALGMHMSPPHQNQQWGAGASAGMQPPLGQQEMLQPRQNQQQTSDGLWGGSQLFHSTNNFQQQQEHHFFAPDSTNSELDDMIMLQVLRVFMNLVSSENEKLNIPLSHKCTNTNTNANANANTNTRTHAHDRILTICV